MNKNFSLGIVAVVIALSFVFLFGINETHGPLVSTSTPSGTNSTSTPNSSTGGSQVSKRAYGEVVMRVGETIPFKYVSLKLLSVISDSRCAKGVQCIWTGTAKIKLHVSNPSGNYDTELELGKTLKTENETIEFVSLSPYPVMNSEILESDYRATLKVTLNPDIKVGGCFVGGCSGQLCSDQPNMASTCEWTEAYACYKTAKCERQSNGQCGWTPTQELNMCLSNAQ
jgi:hypothetical protein